MPKHKRKLTDHQKGIVIAMRAGYRLFKGVTYASLRYGRTTLSIATFFVLKNNGYIKEFGRVTQFGQEYILTELGQTVDVIQVGKP